MTRVIARSVAAAMCSVTWLVPATAAHAEDASGPVQSVVEARDDVTIGLDGTGVKAITFPTTVAGDDVHYVLVVENGCDVRPAGRRCPPPAESATVTLNEDVVLQSDALAEGRQTLEVALNVTDGTSNTIIFAVKGTPRAGLRFAVLAVRPAAVPQGGVSLLPGATADDRNQTLLTVHNAGPAPLAFRLVFYDANGTLAGRSAPRLLAAHATDNVDLGGAAAALGLSWTQGAVHVQWAARTFSRMSSVATEVHREPGAGGGLEVRSVRSLALDDLGPHPLTRAAADDVFGSP